MKRKRERTRKEKGNDRRIKGRWIIINNGINRKYNREMKKVRELTFRETMDKQRKRTIEDKIKKKK